MTPFYWWLIYCIAGYLLMVFAWWQSHDVTLGNAFEFAFCAMFFGPFMVMLYWWSLWLEMRPQRQPIILLKRRKG